jgi:tRNA (mo5U34)-methyltransferase
MPQGIQWWHQIELPGGHLTPGRDRSAAKLAALKLPSLQGKTVLDVGAWDGYFSFAAERLGAARVVALDTYAWRKPGGKDGFQHARAALGSQVEDVEVEVLDISPETVGRFDVVMFLGVLYHMRHPLLALERVAEVARELVVVETLGDFGFLPAPAAAFYPGSFLDDQTNWWGPNRAALVGMLRSAGCTHVEAHATKRLTRELFKDLSTRARFTAGQLSRQPPGMRVRLLRDYARNFLAQSRLVAHGWK